jgi:hypothetical protein
VNEAPLPPPVVPFTTSASALGFVTFIGAL